MDLRGCIEMMSVEGKFFGLLIWEDFSRIIAISHHVTQVAKQDTEVPKRKVNIEHTASGLSLKCLEEI